MANGLSISSSSIQCGDRCVLRVNNLLPRCSGCQKCNLYVDLRIMFATVEDWNLERRSLRLVVHVREAHDQC